MIEDKPKFQRHRRLSFDRVGDRIEGAKTLVLNADYTPMGCYPFKTAGWQEAISMVVCEKADMIHSYEGLVVRSQFMTIEVPSVVAVRTYQRRKRTVRFSRSSVLLRDDYTCQYCGNPKPGADLTLDHVVPRASGGKTTWDNITTSCRECNASKGHRCASQWRSPAGRFGPLVPPYRPSIEEMDRHLRRQPIVVPDARWADYISWSGPVFVNDGTGPRQVSGVPAGPPPEDIPSM